MGERMNVGSRETCVDCFWGRSVGLERVDSLSVFAVVAVNAWVMSGMRDD